jgi:hypothetical protein
MKIGHLVITLLLLAIFLVNKAASRKYVYGIGENNEFKLDSKISSRFALISTIIKESKRSAE